MDPAVKNPRMIRIKRLKLPKKIKRYYFLFFLDLCLLLKSINYMWYRCYIIYRYYSG